jgi:DNA-binding IclR family transcriptional regulator
MRVKCVKEANIPGGAQAVERALSILEFVAFAQTPVTVSEIAQSVGLHRNTAYRLARALLARDYLEVENGTYTLGPRLVVLSQAASRQNVLLRKSDPFLQEVCDAAGEVVNLGIRRGDEVFYLGRWETNEPRPGVYVRIGERAPLYTSALGKVLLAGMSPEARGQYYRRCPFTAFTAHTITNAEDLEQAIRAVQRTGFAEDLEELSDGVRCVAVPITVNGSVVAATSVSFPVVRYSAENRDRYLAWLRAAAAKIADVLASRDPGTGGGGPEPLFARTSDH